jgi:hypothetical protein
MKELIDGAFYCEETPYKLWHSFDKDGKPLITAMTEEQCISGTRFYLKGLQDGWDDTNTIKHEGTVGGKL